MYWVLLARPPPTWKKLFGNINRKSSDSIRHWQLRRHSKRPRLHRVLRPQTHRKHSNQGIQQEDLVQPTRKIVGLLVSSEVPTGQRQQNRGLALTTGGKPGTPSIDMCNSNHLWTHGINRNRNGQIEEICRTSALMPNSGTYCGSKTRTKITKMQTRRTCKKAGKIVWTGRKIEVPFYQLLL